MTSGLRDGPGRLGNLAEELSVLAAQWADRGNARDKAAARQAASEAVGVIDSMLAGLHRMRHELVGEIRVFDDAAEAEAEELLLRRRKGGGRHAR